MNQRYEPAQSQRWNPCTLFRAMGTAIALCRTQIKITWCLPWRQIAVPTTVCFHLTVTMAISVGEMPDIIHRPRSAASVTF